MGSAGYLSNQPFWLLNVVLATLRKNIIFLSFSNSYHYAKFSVLASVSVLFFDIIVDYKVFHIHKKDKFGL